MDKLKYKECESCKDWKGYITVCMATCGKPINALEEFNQYRELGTIDELTELVYLRNRYEDETYDYCGEYGTEECGCKYKLERLKEYEQIGTVEECREAVEKQNKRKPFKSPDEHMNCHHCEEVVKYPEQYCQNCGQAIDWSEV